jgi:alpha-D-ribose 1-methylphosphonate 5-triphosphate diphosphatase
MSGLIIANVNIVTPERIIERGCVYVKNGFVESILPSSNGISEEHYTIINGEGCYLLPGFIDLHNDDIEKKVMPRPNAYFPIPIAVTEIERVMASHGITTAFHSISFEAVDFGLRSIEFSKKMIDGIRELNIGSGLIRNKLHLRFEVSAPNIAETVEQLLETGCIDLISLMDHTPGQGQFKTEEAYKDYYRKTFKLNEEELKHIISKKTTGVDLKKINIEKIIKAAKAKNIPLASHDDDSVEKVLSNKEYGIMISEFPVNMQVAKKAHEENLFICLGAPNIVRGKSQAGNISARELIVNGIGNILCSDYYPASILHAVFNLASDLLTLNEAVNMASLYPARAAGIDKLTGSLEEGKEADMLMVDTKSGIPVIKQTFVKGNSIARFNYFD